MTEKSDEISYGGGTGDEKTTESVIPLEIRESQLDRGFGGCYM